MLDKLPNIDLCSKYYRPHGLYLSHYVEITVGCVYLPVEVFLSKAREISIYCMAILHTIIICHILSQLTINCESLLISLVALSHLQCHALRIGCKWQA